MVGAPSSHATVFFVSFMLSTVAYDRVASVYVVVVYDMLERMNIEREMHYKRTKLTVLTTLAAAAAPIVRP